MKKIRLQLILAAVLIAVVIIVIIAWRPKLVAINNSAEVLNIEGANAQSYAVEQAPVWRDGDMIFGSSEATVKIFVYEDYASIYSAALAKTLAKARTEFKKSVAVIVRPYVLENSTLSRSAALIVTCAAEQKKWAEMRTLVFAQAENQQAIGDNLDEYVEQIGLNKNKFDLCLTNEEKSGKIEQAMAEAVGYGVLGAPTIFIGSEMILGARPYADFVDSNGDTIEGLRATIMKKLAEVD
jgi:protein-disulfide isomerase